MGLLVERKKVKAINHQVLSFMSQRKRSKNSFTLTIWQRMRKLDKRNLCLMDIIWPISQSYFHVSHFMFVEMKLIHCYSCMMFVMKSMSTCTDKANCDETILY